MEQLARVAPLLLRSQGQRGAKARLVRSKNRQRENTERDWTNCAIRWKNSTKKEREELKSLKPLPGWEDFEKGKKLRRRSDYDDED